MPYDWGCVFPSAPVFVDDEIRIYYGASDWYFFDWRKGGLALATLGKDRWAGYEPLNNNSEAIVTTVPLMLGNRISVTADVGKGGLISVNVLDSENVTVCSQLIRTSCTDFSLSFESKSFDLAGKKYAIQFKVRGAKVYSFSIR